ncbi:MAG: imidazole glycerol phosphate synthase subunit HisH [Caulobacterales bacterium]|uniref:imidazole glycerol phosphate synthase subunit HisH n=1 Tax=Glycocaulis sp. TaxID=1969725 RepID=UPI003FA12CF9
MTLALIDTSTANIASVRYALERLGVEPVLASTPQEAAGAKRLILPGVGAAGPAMRALEASGWADALRNDTRPLLGVCLGMQLLFGQSAEDSGQGGPVSLLGLVPGSIERLDPAGAGPWPHMGWNTLEFDAGSDPLLEGIEPGAHVYFVHGFYAPAGPATIAQTGYGARISAMVRHGHVAGCQFHPERSGAVGARILSNFVRG